MILPRIAQVEGIDLSIAIHIRQFFNLTKRLVVRLPDHLALFITHRNRRTPVLEMNIGQLRIVGLVYRSGTGTFTAEKPDLEDP